MSTTMSRMCLYLLGPPRVEVDGQEITFPRRKSLALLIYLAVNGSAQRRDTLATLLWPESSQSRARGALRRELTSMRRILGAEWLATDGDRVALQPAEEIWLDVHEFEARVDNDEGFYLDRVATAVTLYRDDFLAGFTLAGAPGFDEWQFFHAESLRQTFASALEQLVGFLSDKGDEENAITYARRWLALDPLHEPAHRCLMQLYAFAGQQAAALRQYQICRQMLDDELGVPPAPETTTLYEQIRDRRIGPDENDRSPSVIADVPSQPDPLSIDSIGPVPRPAFLDDAAKATAIEESVFVERQRELAQLDRYLNEALAGHGKVVFVTGGAGRGKTRLLREFVSRAQATHATLLAANGHCSAHAGVGDPYLPFRDVMEMMAGAVEAKWTAGEITRQHARRLWQILPETVKTLIDAGPDLIDIFVRGRALVGRAAAVASDESIWVARLKALVTQKQVESAGMEQSYLFEQYVCVLQNLAAQYPLLLTLDDLQWADTASTSLLFHLGRRIEGSRILVVGAYRPEEVALDRDNGRHPLQKVLSEFKRTYGNIEINLARSARGEGQRFVDVLLDTEGNQLGEEFRQSLFLQTGGHPLFTIELLRALQVRGDLVQDEEKRWIEGPALDWQILPARVEGVIEERIGRLNAELLDILTAASVEGEVFTLEVVAHVQGLERRELLRYLSQELQGRHRLVREREEMSIGAQLLVRYQFVHILFQRYLYDRLGMGERRYLHREIGQALERLYEGQTEEIAAQLAHHFGEAGEQTKAVVYARRAARRATAVYAYEEAIQHLQTALDLLEGSGQIDTRLTVLEELGDANSLLSRSFQAISLYRKALEEWSSLTGREETIALRLHRKILENTVRALWLVDFEEFETLPETVAASRAYLETSLSLAQNKPTKPEQISYLTALANYPHIGNRLPLDVDSAERYAKAAVALAEKHEAPVALSDALEALNNVYFARGRIRERLEISRRRLALTQEPRFSDVRRQILILEDMGKSLMLVGQYAEAIPYLQEEEERAKQIRGAAKETSAMGYQALCWFRLDRWDEVFKFDEKQQDLERRYPSQTVAARCLIVSPIAAVQALRGEAEQACALREQVHAMMVRSAAGSSENWEQSHHY